MMRSFLSFWHTAVCIPAKKSPINVTLCRFGRFYIQKLIYQTMDEKQMTSIFEQLQRRLSRYAHSLFHHDEDAEDALQDAFCSLWLHRRDINDPNHAQAIAITQVKRASIDAHRRQERHGVVPLDEHHADGAYSHVAEDAERHDAFRRIEQIVMQQLSEREQTVFRMKEYSDMSTEEIASQLGISPEAVRKALSRARITIRNHFNNSCEL